MTTQKDAHAGTDTGKEGRVEVRLSGFGGQGIVLAGNILGRSVALFEGKNAVFTQSYGPEARGGASRSEVIVARGEIDYPKVMSADLLLCMSQEACDKFHTGVKEDGCIVVDSSNVSRLPSYRAIAVPIYLRQLGWTNMNPAWDSYFNQASKALLFLAGTSGAGMILYFVIKAYRQRRQIHQTLMSVEGISEAA